MKIVIWGFTSTHHQPEGDLPCLFPCKGATVLDSYILDPWSILIQFLWKMWSLAMFLFLYMDIWFSSTIWKIDFHSPLDCFLILCQRSISWPYLYGSILGLPFLYSWICIYSFVNTVIYWPLWFMLSWETQENVLFCPVILQIIMEYIHYVSSSNSFFLSIE